MNKPEYLLTCASEECHEVSEAVGALGKRLSKALRFGLNETQEGQLFNNEERIMAAWDTLALEIIDLEQILKMKFPTLRGLDMIQLAVRYNHKRDRVEKYMDRSRKNGCLSE